MRFRLDSLGLKLNFALLVFFIVLGSATAAFIFIGFRNTRANATDRSQEALEQIGAQLLQFTAQTQADVGAIETEWAAEIGHRASRYMEAFKATGATASYDISRLVQTADDVWYDPDPNRVSDLVVPNHLQLEGGVVDDIVYSAALDPLFPALLEGFPGELSEEAYHPITIVFIGLNSVGRIYPPIGSAESGPAELDLSSFYDRFGPVTNPERLTTWTVPYEDMLGKGLVITAQTPVYQGDRFRGIFEVDLSIDKLVEQINEIKPTENGFAFYVDKEGGVLHTGAYDLLAEELSSQQNDALARIVASMQVGEAGVDRIFLGGQEFFIAYAGIGGVGGGIAVVAPRAELTAEAAAITAEIDDQADRTMVVVLGSMTALFGGALVGATYLNRRLLVRPIEALVRGTRSVAKGDFDTSIPISGNDEIATLAQSFNTMTAEIVAARGDLERQVEERTRELSALLEVSRNVASTLELSPLLNVIIEQVEGVAEYNRCSLYLLEGDVEGDILRLLASRVNEPGVASAPGSHQFRTQDMGSVWRQLSAGRAVVIADLHVEDEATSDLRRALGPELQCALGGVHALMAVPLSLNERTFGMLTLNHKQPGFYTEQHMQLVSAIAAQAAVAIENARLYGQAQQLAAVDERQRLARELHDSVSQALFGIALGARTARTQLDRDPAQAVGPVEYVLSLAEAGLAEMRSLIFELRPESLEIEGLVAALEKQVAATTARYGIEVTAELAEEPELPIGEKEVFYRIGQEALHNVVKHAHAGHASVRLTATDGGGVTLEVSDDGLGFDPDQSFPGHMGLVSMRERAASIGASLEVMSAPGRGTTLRVSIVRDEVEASG